MRLWRTILRVQRGEANLYLKRGSNPSAQSYDYKSERVGSDAITIPVGAFASGEEWHVFVSGSTDSAWTLVSGEVFVNELPIGDPAHITATIGFDGSAFFKTSLPPSTRAWALWTSGSEEILVRKSLPPFGGTSDLTATSRMLVTPDYVGGGVFDGFYFVTVRGAPGASLDLFSESEVPQLLEFSSTTQNTNRDSGFSVFQVNVPVTSAIAWEISVIPSKGNPNFAVRRGKIPNARNNDAYSEVAAPVTDSITLTSPFLIDGAYFITVYGAPQDVFTLRNMQPEFPRLGVNTDVFNAYTNRTGWSYFLLGDIPEQQQAQLLGLEFALSNAAPGTEIAIRRNAPPGVWKYRADGHEQSQNAEYLDAHSETGLLQRPAQQADIWYVGVYNPDQALGPFSLQSHPIVPQNITLDGTDVAVTAQSAGAWRFFKLDIPPSAASAMAGLDLRVNQVTQGNPKFAVRRGQLPAQLESTPGWSLGAGTTWPVGQSWGGGIDWTGYWLNADGSAFMGQMLSMGLGNPLEPGTYYIGVRAELTSSYHLSSRAIGESNSAIPVESFDFQAGSVEGVVEPREAKYFKVLIPPGIKAWKIKLIAVEAETRLLAQFGAIPNGGAALLNEERSQSVFEFQGGAKVAKLGNEHLLILPPYGQTELPAGAYYLAVVGEGFNPGAGRIGPGNSRFKLESKGPFAPTQLGSISRTTISVTGQLEAGETMAYQFQIPAAALTSPVSLQCQLQENSGQAHMRLVRGGQIPGIENVYGIYSGNDLPGSESDSWISIQNPLAETYTLLVAAARPREPIGSETADFVIKIGLKEPTNIAFDGGTQAVVEQLPGTWRFFRVDVPSDANVRGWDVRLRQITSGAPRMVVCREQLPLAVQTQLGLPYGTKWPVGQNWAGQADWDELYSSGSDLNVLSMGLGNPLEPGTYYIGVTDDTGTAPLSYTLLSRGIGATQSIPVVSLARTNGDISASIPSGEVSYYQTEIPAGVTNWELKLTLQSDDALLVVNKGTLPSIAALARGNGGSLDRLTGGLKLERAGNEHFLLLPPEGGTQIPLGTYFIAIVAQQHAQPAVHTGLTAYRLESTVHQPVDLGVISASPHTVSGRLQAGQTQAYEFKIPPGAVSLEGFLRSTNEHLTVTFHLAPTWPALIENYGFEGPQDNNPMRDSRGVFNLSNPDPGKYYLLVHAAAADQTDSSFTLSVGLQEATPLQFDGGIQLVTDQPESTWKFWRVEVPESTNLLGWDIRLDQVIAGNSILKVCRGALPVENGPGFNGFPWQVGTSIQGTADWSTTFGSSDPAKLQLIEVGMRNPLQAGVYYVGVFAPAGNGTSTYRLRSRAIGYGFSIPVTDLVFGGGRATNSVSVHEACYYHVRVPAGVANWKVALNAVEGDVLLMALKSAIPNSRAELLGSGLPIYSEQNGIKMKSDGSEHLLLLPPTGDTVVPAGDYYLAVAHQSNPTGSEPATASYILTSAGALPAVGLGVLGSQDLSISGSLEGGESSLYQFEVPSVSTLLALELRFESQSGHPVMFLRSDARSPGLETPGNVSRFARGVGSGEAAQFDGDSIVTVPNCLAGTYSILVNSGSLLERSDPVASRFVLKVHPHSVTPLSVVHSSDPGALAAEASGALADGQSAFYRFEVPSISPGGIPLFGWRLSVASSGGRINLKARKLLLPQRYGGSDQVQSEDQLNIAPPFLAPGTWYVEVEAEGSADFRLSSDELKLERSPWILSDQTPQTPFGDFADTGSDGVDLQRGYSHYYAVSIPHLNSGVLRTVLESINGAPLLYIRAETPSTMPNYSPGNLYDRALEEINHTQYGNWVPLDGKTESELPTGTWYLQVRAGNQSDARYRLRLSTGNAVIQLIPPSGALNGISISGGDWRYFKVQSPPSLSRGWSIGFSESSGDVRVYVRDTIPPGERTSAQFVDWETDGKDPLARGHFDAPGSYTIGTPPLRPGAVYYIGVYAQNDAVFNLSSFFSSETIPLEGNLDFYSGVAQGTLAAGASKVYRVATPSAATLWKQTATRGEGVELRLGEGTLPGDAISSLVPPNAQDDFENPIRPAAWPWIPGNIFYLSLTNNSKATQPYEVKLAGRSSATDDTDGDGLPDQWERDHFGNLSQTAQGDPDNDGLTNLQEFTFATNPRDPNTRPIISGRIGANGTYELTLTGEVGQTYDLESSSNLISWMLLNSITANEPITTMRPEISAANSFYRARLRR